jgi:cytochrome b
MHWTTVLAVAGAWASAKLPGDWYRYHLWCGYTVLVSATTRIVWGWIGTRHARFASFVQGPAEVLRYARALRAANSPRTAGHNPLGALMILLLLALLLALSLTGLFANDEITNAGPLYGYVSNDTSNRLTGLHSTLANVLLGAIALHVTAVLTYLIVKRENLIRPMITGRKPADSIQPADAIGSSRSWLALAVALVIAALLAIVVRTAPEATLVLF